MKHKEWVSTRSMKSSEFSWDFEFPGPGNYVDINLTDLAPLIHIAGFSALEIITADLNVADKTYSQQPLQISHAFVDNKAHKVPFQLNVPWPILKLYIDIQAMTVYQRGNAKDNRTYATQLNRLLKKHIIGKGWQENSGGLASGLDAALGSGQFLYYWDLLYRYSQDESIAVLSSTLLTLLSHYSLSRSVRGMVFGSGGLQFGKAKKYTGAKQSLFFGTKFDRLALLFYKGATATLAAPHSRTRGR